MVRLTAIAHVALLAALISLLPPAAAHSRAAGMAISATGSSTGQGLRPASPPWEPAGVPIVDGLVITNSVTLEPGVYNVEDIAEDGLIFIDGDDITLDGAGVYINGVDYGGYGIVVNALDSGRCGCGDSCGCPSAAGGLLVLSSRESVLAAHLITHHLAKLSGILCFVHPP